MMRSALLVGLAASLALTSVATAAEPDPVVARTLDALPTYRPGPPVRGTIVLWGHGSFKRDFMGKLVTRWFAELRRRQPGIVLDYRMYGTASAIGALASGAGTLAILGEEISPDAKRMFMRAKGYAPTQIEIANGSVDVNFFDYAHMIVVHRDNPLAKLTRAQIEAVFGAEHRCAPADIRTWGGLGLTGDWTSRPIVPYGWKADVDFGLFVRERVLCDSHRWNPALREFVHVIRPDGTQYDHGQQIVDAVARDRYGIGISNVRYATPGVRVLPLAWTAAGPYVMPSEATIIDRSYPLTRIIPAIVDRPPGRPMPAVERELLRYVLSREGQTALVEESGYLPLSPAIVLRERRKLD